MRTIIGVMGGGTADARTTEAAYRLGTLIAEEGWVLLNGGRDAGVMSASATGASESRGLTIGVLPDDHLDHVAPDIDIPILTGIGDARNVVNVLSSRAIIAMQGGAGTISEVALALKSGRKVVTVDFHMGVAFKPYYDSGMLIDAETPEEAVGQVKRILAEKNYR